MITLDSLFLTAQTAQAFLDKPVTDAQLQQAYDAAKMAPTAFNCSPMRIVFVKSAEAKAKLAGALQPGNVDKTNAAPVTAIIGYDVAFFNELPKLFPYYDAKPIFENNAALAEQAAFRNGTLQGAYFLLALRSLGLESGAMSGFDNAKVDELFFAGTSVKSNFLMNIGYADVSKNYPRAPRLTFAEATKTV
jgi:3-hydroxypropanoate dehydrogenase